MWSIVPFYLTLGVLSAIFVFARVRRTPELASSSAYQPGGSISVWLARLSEYAGMLTYGRVHPMPLWTGLALLGTLALALLYRNKAMVFGWCFFLVTITPVALISSRPGYVLYLPELGLGLYFAGALAYAARELARVAHWKAAVTEYAVFLLVLCGATLVHARNWHPDRSPSTFSQCRALTDQFRAEYPTLTKGSRLLFVTDYFLKDSWELLFNLRLLYRDRELVADRFGALPSQAPDRTRPLQYDRIFEAQTGRYVELDPRNPAESIRLHILRGYRVGPRVDFSKRDYGPT
jgi:hypothetical protein